VNYTDQQIIERYVALKDAASKLKDEYTAKVKPYQDGMAKMEEILLARLIERGAENTKTDAGTAYKSNLLTVKVADREKFIDFIMSTWTDDAGQPSVGQTMLLAQPQKDAVKEFIERSGGHPPPGLEVSYYTNVNIRRS
jgi:hypothetical protein